MKQKDKVSIKQRGRQTETQKVTCGQTDKTDSQRKREGQDIDIGIIHKR